jgi:hypothetical protein
MRKLVTTVFATAVVMALAAPVLAGGFFVLLGNPEAAEARSHNAFATIKAAGCHQPEKASITATAIGVVDGRRQSVPLKLVPLSEPGMYAVARQWPAEGRWMLQFVATDQDRVTSTVVAVGPAGIERQTAKFRPGQPAPEDVAALLKSGTTVSAASK